MSRPRRHVLAVEGNIGTGKSTTIDGLNAKYREDLRVAVIPEDVAGWEERGLLKALYDGTLHTGTFQACALMPQIVKLHQALQDPAVELVIMERSPWSNYHVFAKSNLDETHLGAHEYIFDEMIKLLEPYDLCIHFAYLDVSAEVSIERRIARGRKSEENLPAAYIEQLDAAHWTFFKNVECERLLFTYETDITIVPSGSKEEVVELIGGKATMYLGLTLVE